MPVFSVGKLSTDQSDSSAEQPVEEDRYLYLYLGEIPPNRQRSVDDLCMHIVPVAHPNPDLKQKEEQVVRQVQVPPVSGRITGTGSFP